MLSCIYEEKVFTTKEEGYTTNDKYTLGRERKLLCPVCKTSVFFCEDGEKIAHFTHHKLGDCPMGKYRSYDYSATEKHYNLVDKFVDWVKSQFPGIKVYPDYLISNELFTDIYFELGSTKIAIEIQFKNFSNPTFIKRRELYKIHNIKDIWFFVQNNGEEFSIGSPYQRTYYRENKRELYFYMMKEDICKIYKGFAKEKWEEVGKNTLNDAVSVKVPLKHIKIRNNGTLMIHELKNKYLQTLKDKREKNRQDKVVPKGSLLDRVKQHKKMVEDKAFTQDYKEYRFERINGKEYLNVVIMNQGVEHKDKYLILKKRVERKEMYLTCRKESEPGSIMYCIDINPFLDSMKKIKIQKYDMR